MANRAFCDQEGNEHTLVPPIVEVRDNLGSLAVQILVAKENLAKTDYCELIHKLYDITVELHQAYNDERDRIPY